MSIWDDIAAERLLLADLVESLSPDQLSQQSLCGRWTVHEVAAHVVVPLCTSRMAFVAAMLRARGSFHRANAAVAAAVARQSPAELAAILRRQAGSRFTPPLHGPTAPLTDLLIHGQDIRRPLGLTREFVPDRLRTALDFLGTPRAHTGFVARGRLDALRWVATDLDWSFGSGAEVRGTGEALLLAMTGRDVVLPELAGAGVAVLGARAAAGA